MRPIAACLLLCIPFTFAAETETPLPTRVEAVTVFLDRALVSRSGGIDLPAGRSSVMISGLPQELDEQTLRLALSGAASLESVAVHTVWIDQEPPQARIAALQAECATLAARLRVASDALAVCEETARYVTAIPMPGAEPAQSPMVQLWQPRRAGLEEHAAMIAFLREQRSAIAAQKRVVETDIAALTPVLNQRRNELDALTRTTRSETRAVVATLNAAKPARVVLSVQYLVPGATWFPVYDARCDLSAATLDLTSDAIVMQATGEDWADAKLTLSAARPSTRIGAPDVRPFVIGAPVVTSMPAEMQQRDRQVQNDNVFSSRFESQTGNYDPHSNLVVQSLNRVGNNKAAHAQLLQSYNGGIALLAQVAETRSTSTALPINGKSTVHADGRPHRLRLATQRLPVALVRSVAPQVATNTAVSGTIVNRSALPLLPGTVNVFHGEDLVGSTSLGFAAQNESTELWLGIDEQVKATRTLDLAASTRSLFNGNVGLELAYRIGIENFRTRPVRIVLREALPVAHGANVRAKILDVTAPTTRDREICTWDMNVAPATAAAATGTPVRVAYRLEYPANAVPVQLETLDRTVPTR